MKIAVVLLLSCLLMWRLYEEMIKEKLEIRHIFDDETKDL